MDSVDRRRFLIATAAGSTGLLTGCIGGGGNGDSEGNETEGEGNDTGGSDGGESPDDGEGGAESGDGADTDEGDVSLGGVYRTNPPREFAFEGEMKDGDGTISGRHYHGDVYVQFESEQGTGEYYEIGDNNNKYLVSEEMGMCIEDPGSDMTPSEGEREVDTEEYESDVEEYATLSPTGTTTIDGEQMYVFELTPEMTGNQETSTYYVSVNSGYLRRVETSDRVLKLHSWGEVEPVEAPDMECRDMSDMPSGF